MGKSNTNFDRMIRLAEQFFHVKNDPSQISVTAEAMVRLRMIHPSTLSEESDVNGPVAWVVVIPTSSEIMARFLSKEIAEKDILDQTPLGGRYTAVYLCSALVLPEYRSQGIARRLTVSALNSIRKDHPVASLFFWAFSPEGERLAKSIANACGLPLFRRIDSPEDSA